MPRALIVDDFEQNISLLRALLEGYDFEVESARNGAEALERARSTPPDVVISDILMPTMDGFSLLREWKQDDILTNIPFIVYTATYTDSRDEELALRLGAARFIVKPVDPGVFISSVRQAIESYRAGRIAAPPKQLDDETVYYRMYNESLVRKLEEKMLALAEANRALEEDIIKRTQTEKALQQFAQQWQTTFDALEDGICILDRDQKVVLCNRAFERLVQRPETEIVGRHCWEAMHGTDKPYPDCPVVRAYQTLRRETLLIEIQGRFFEVTVDPVVDAAGAFCSAVHIVRDVTEQKRSEQALRRNFEELQRWHEATLNREDRMLELKQEVNELCKRLGEPLRYGPEAGT